MKHLLFATLLLLTVPTLAQNNGQYVQNNAVKLAFAGLINGNYYVRITNKTGCLASIKYEYGSITKAFTLNSYDDTLLKVGTSIQGVVRVKNSANCWPHTDNGWVELCLSVTPLKFISSKAMYLESTDEVQVDFEVADVINVDHINVEVSVDGGHTYRQVALLWPEALLANKKYSVKISAARIREQIK